jgi:hypothetical protein
MFAACGKRGKGLGAGGDEVKEAREVEGVKEKNSVEDPSGLGTRLRVNGLGSVATRNGSMRLARG